MPRLRAARLLSAWVIVATAVVAACSGFSSEETAPAGDASANEPDVESVDANQPSVDGSSSDGSADGSSCSVDAGTSVPLGPYTFDEGGLPLEGWSFDGLAPGGVQISQRRIQISTEQSVSAPSSLKVAATSGALLATQSLFMSRTLDEPATGISLTAKMYVSNRCNSSGCPDGATIARLTLVSGRRLYWVLMADGTMSVQGDQATSVFGKTPSSLDAWKEASLTVSAGGSMTVGLGEAKATLPSAIPCSDRIASLSIGVKSGEFGGGAGWVYYLDNLQITASHGSP